MSGQDRRAGSRLPPALRAHERRPESWGRSELRRRRREGAERWRPQPTSAARGDTLRRSTGGRSPGGAGAGCVRRRTSRCHGFAGRRPGRAQPLQRSARPADPRRPRDARAGARAVPGAAADRRRARSSRPRRGAEHGRPASSACSASAPGAGPRPRRRGAASASWTRSTRCSQGSFLDTKKTRSLISHIRKVLSGGAGLGLRGGALEDPADPGRPAEQQLSQSSVDVDPLPEDGPRPVRARRRSRWRRGAS